MLGIKVFYYILFNLFRFLEIIYIKNFAKNALNLKISNFTIAKF